MTTFAESQSLAEAQRLARLIDSGLGYPKRATRVVGRQEPIAPQWDGVGRPPFGWCPRYAVVYERSDGAAYGIRVDAAVRALDGVQVPDPDSPGTSARVQLPPLVDREDDDYQRKARP
jgi:hypothetical protein